MTARAGLGEILVQMKFCTWNFALDVFGSEIQFYKHFATELFWFEAILIGKNWVLTSAENTEDFQNLKLQVKCWQILKYLTRICWQNNKINFLFVYMFHFKVVRDILSVHFNKNFYISKIYLFFLTWHVIYGPHRYNYPLFAF